MKSIKGKDVFLLCGFSLMALLLFASASGIQKNKKVASKKAKILVFSLTKKYRHTSIRNGKAAIIKLGLENNFDVDTTESTSSFTNDNLKKYKALIFLSPTGDSLLTEDQQQAFQRFIQRGGGFVGIHAATDCLYSWPWYGKLVGAYFANHPAVQEAKLILTDSSHVSTRGLRSPWMHTDEWYNFKSFNPDVQVLLTADEGSYKGGKMGTFHPVSWFHRFDGGRAFYTALGHTPETYEEPLFLKHLLGGIQYALGRKQ